MKKLYEEQKHSLYQIQKALNLHIMRLYRYAEGVVSVDKMPIDLLFNLAKFEGLDPDILFKKMKDYQEKKKSTN